MNLKKFGQFILILTICFGWIFSGWPQIINFPSKVDIADAAITYESAGAIAYSTANAVPYPASVAAGDLLVLIIGQKPSSVDAGSVTMPTGWTAITSLTGAGGYGATLGVDTGNTNIFAFYKVATGLEVDSAVFITNTSNVSWAQMHRLSNATEDWSVAGTTGSDTTAGNVSITMSADPGVASGDFIFGAMTIPTDVTTPSQFSAQAFTQTGITFGAVTEISEPDTPTGNDLGGFIVYSTATSGTSSAAPVMTATAGGTTTNVRGPGIFIRVRATGTITYESSGSLAYAGANGLGGIIINYPASIASNNILVLIVGQKPGTVGTGSVNTPEGWTAITSLTDAGGYGATLAADTGNTHVFAFYKVADGTETGTLGISLTFVGQNPVAWSQMYRLSNSNNDWSVAGTTGSDTSGDSSVSITMSSDPGVTANDFIFGAMVIPTDVTTPSQFSAQAFTQTGITFGSVTEISEPDATGGFQAGGFIVRAPVSSGTSSAAPVMTATAGGTTTNVRGPGIFIRVRELMPTFEQSAYRWFANANSTDVGSALASQDTSATLTSAGQEFRLRQLVHIGTGKLGASGQNLKLQFATKSGTCDTSFTGETYADVTGSTAIAYKDNSTPADGDNLTSNANDPTHSGHTIVNQDYEELNNFTNTVAEIPAGQDGKWDFSLKDNSAPAGTSYCFRLRKSDDSALDTYTVIPEITTFSAPQSLTFSISDNSVGFGTLSASSARYATGDGVGASSESAVNGTIPSITFAGGVTEVKATRTLTVNSAPSFGATTIGSCVVAYALTGSGSETDCSDNAATIDTDTYFSASEVAGSMRNLTNVTDSAHGALTVSGSGTSVIFTTTGTETSATAINFSDTTGDAVTSSSSTSGVIGVAATVTIAITDSLTANATDKSVEVDTLGAIDLGTSALTASGVADAIRTGITGAGGYAAKNYTVSGSGANIIFTRKSTGSSGNGSLTINDDTYTNDNGSGDAHTISASTNGTGGYAISVNGTTLTCSCGSPTINAIGSSATASSVGSEQFGLRVIVNSGTGSATSPYSTSNWAFDTAAFPDQIASGASDDVTSVFGIRYIANITNTTEAGNYSATLTYTATATF